MKNIALDYISKKYKIFIDTCSLLDPSFLTFMDYIKDELEQSNNKLIIPYAVISELYEHKKNTLNQELSKKAKEVLLYIQDYYKKNKYIKIMGEETEQFADNVLQTVFTKYRLKYDLVLITQDNDLAKSILKLKRDPSVLYIKKIKVLKLDSNGQLRPFFDWQTQKNYRKNNNFNILSLVTKTSDDMIKVNYIPKEGDIITSKMNGPVRLLECLGGGGEGNVFRTNTVYIAKVYREGKLTLRKQKKLELMVTKDIYCKGVCYPVDLLYNKKNEFVGYLMPEAKGLTLQTLFIKPLMMENFPHWKKRELVELAVTILKKIQYLHNRNIILGDINPTNIQIVSPKEVYFVDTDSYQIEDYPCPVGTVNYTAPELQGKKYENYLRTFGNEYFAVATLLFMLMLPGKPPYAQQGGGYPQENIRGMNFPYPFMGAKGGIPEGPWRYCWSHLTYELKKAFYETFMKWENIPTELKNNPKASLENHSSENNRYDVATWLRIFRKYLNLLKSGKFRQQDPMSEEIFPTRFKCIPREKYSNFELSEKDCLDLLEKYWDIL